MSAFRFKSCFLLFFSLILLNAPTRAEIGEPIEFIRVEGTQRVEEETVLAYMLVREGLKDEADLVDQSVKTLFSSVFLQMSPFVGKVKG